MHLAPPLESIHCRAVGRSENPGVPVLFGGHNLPPFVELGLTDLPESGGAHAMAPPETPGTTPLHCIVGLYSIHDVGRGCAIACRYTTLDSNCIRIVHVLYTN